MTGPFLLEIGADPAAVALAVAEHFVRVAGEAIAARGRFTVALAGGSTPREAYRHLAEPGFASRVDWSRVEVFWGDERCVPPTDLESNYRMAWETLLSRVEILPDHIHRVDGEREPRAAAEAYQAILIGRLGPTVALDLVLLGMGPDGHTASLFPGSPALDDGGRFTAAIRGPKPPTERITLTLTAINRAREVAFMVTGTEKAATLATVLEAGAERERLPAGAVRPAAGRLRWFVDREAISRIDRTA